MRRALVMALLLLAACEGTETRLVLRAPRPRRHSAPMSMTFPGQFPYVVAAGDGSLLVSYFDHDALKLVAIRGGVASVPKTIAAGGLLVNRADFPSIAQQGKTIWAQWIVPNGHSSAIRIARSDDGGTTWSKPVQPHPEMVSEFGFTSLLPLAGGSLRFVWLDGRKLKGGEEGEGDMELHGRTLRADGSMDADETLDPRVCDCCQTSIAMAGSAPVVAYRDRSDAEIRDIAVIAASQHPVHADGYHINGCPVNGPRIAANGNRAVAAWFTAADGKNEVRAAFSDDSAATFSQTITIAAGASVAGHVDVVLLGDGSAIVTWIEGKKLMSRPIADAGPSAAASVVAEDAEGFPRMAVSDDNVVVAWTSGGEKPAVELATIPLTK